MKRSESEEERNDCSSSELEEGAYYSGKEFQQNEELSDSELKESGNGEEEE